MRVLRHREVKKLAQSHMVEGAGFTQAPLPLEVLLSHKPSRTGPHPSEGPWVTALLYPHLLPFSILRMGTCGFPWAEHAHSGDRIIQLQL